MAIPRVFISSTCYDLSEIRDSLLGFLESYCYEPVLSERGDIFYHPDLHTHDACVNEIKNCQLLILIIGGRFGGSYKADVRKSVTNAEYLAAKKLSVPVFTFVKHEVNEDHRVYQKNKQNKDIIDKIDFPSIEKKEYAKQIFEFINEVRLSEVNNGFFAFEHAKHIKELLGKQFAGMMYDFLSKRKDDKEQQKTNLVLDNLTSVQKKIEEIIENIYKKVDSKEAVKKIEEIDKEIEAENFLNEVKKKFYIQRPTFKNVKEVAEIVTADKSLVQFLIATNEFYTIDQKSNKFNEIYTMLYHIRGGGWTVAIKNNNIIQKASYPEITELEEHYKAYQSLDKRSRLKVLKSFSKSE